jgi:hypothetical protein
MLLYIQPNASMSRKLKFGNGTNYHYSLGGYNPWRKVVIVVESKIDKVMLQLIRLWN